MKILIDFFPIAAFVAAYVLTGDLYMAVFWLLGATAAQLAMSWLIWRKLDKIHLFTFALLLVFGAATLVFREPLFIQWKPTVVTWCLALFFYGSTYIGKKSVMERLLAQKLELPSEVWIQITRFWALFFFLSGAANLYVFMNFSESAWVYFKLYGQLGLTFVFLLLQGIYIGIKMKEKN